MAGVIASMNLPFGAVSRPLSPKQIATLAPSLSKIEVQIDGEGFLFSEEVERLVQSLQVSGDFHSCSAILERGSGHTVILRLIRSLKHGEEMTLWFSQDLQAVLDIPFLNPANIQGEKNYVCHRCKKVYENPNPLKLHLALNCGQLKMSDLWQRLKKSFLNSNKSRIEESCNKMVKLSLAVNDEFSQRRKRTSPPSPSLSSYSNPSPERRIEEETRPASEPPRHCSAFRPYLSLKMGSDSFNDPFNKSLMKESEAKQVKTENLTEELYMNHQAANIETMVSNLGQSKQGHLCLYCGKIYSRKYGLKIHIRYIVREIQLLHQYIEEKSRKEEDSERDDTLLEQLEYRINCE